MCGIAGIAAVTDNRPIEKNILETMTNLLSHRGPDGCGFHFEEGVGFGHRRLAIIDLEGGQQPMPNEDESIWISCNGEIYNFQELNEQLKSLGHIFKTKCDTEVIIHAYEQWGENAFNRFNGMFAFGLWDRRKRRLLLVRDRMGVKPLYWAKVEDRLLFSSEVKSILAYPVFQRCADLDSISSYLTFRQAVGDHSFFKGINKLSPGHFLILCDGRIEIIKYYDIPVKTNNKDLGEEYYLDKIQSLLSTSVKDRMMSDVPLGAYLSGGLDSSILVALMSKLGKNSVKTFSIGYEEKEYNEGYYAGIVSEYCGTDHHQITLSDIDYLDIWKKMIKHKDAPLSIPHEIPLYRMSVKLKEHITVVLSGEGADELFGGYGRVQRSPMDWKKISCIRNLITPALADFLAKSFPNHSFISKLNISDHLSHFFNVYNWMPFEEKWDLMTPDANDEIACDNRTIKIFKEIFEKTKHIDTYDRILNVFEKIHLSCLLDRLDMMSMAASVEARVPFVDDHELVDFVTNIPFHHKMRWKSKTHQFRATFHDSFRASEWLDINKYILRRLGHKLLPQEITKRKKLGFPTPLDSWFKGGLIDFAKEILLDDMTINRGIFKRGKMEEFLSSTQNLPYDFYGKKIWMLMNIELWFRQFFNNNAKTN